MVGQLVAHISGGRFGYALRLVEKDDLLEMREERLNELLTLLPASRVEKFKYADQLANDKDAMRQTILFWLSYWLDVMLAAALDAQGSPGDVFRVRGAEVYLRFGSATGAARTKLTVDWFDRQLATVTTVRNCRTTRTLCEMASD